MHRLLIVEDSPSLRLALAAACEDAGYAVLEAWDGQDALMKVGMYAPDLILCDVMMPGMNGIDFMHRLRSHPDHALIPIIIMTRYHEAVSTLDPALPILLKPFSLGEVLALIEGALVI